MGSFIASISYLPHHFSHTDILWAIARHVATQTFKWEGHNLHNTWRQSGPEDGEWQFVAILGSHSISADCE